MSNTKLHKGDKVVVISGKDRKKEGTILRILQKQERVVVEGVNMKIKHIKKTASKAGEKITFEGALHISNVMLVDPKTGKRTRVGYDKDAKGKKIRVAKKSKEVIAKSTK